MALNRYAQDYRLTETVDEKGRIRRGAEYIGGSYFFVEPKAVIRKNAWILLFCSVTGWVGVFLAFLYRSPLTESLITALPLAFSFLPLALLTKTGIALLIVKEPMRHVQADRFTNHIPPIALFMMIFAVVSMAAGMSVILGQKSVTGTESLFFCGALMTAASGWVVFRRRHVFQTTSADTESITEKEDERL